MNFSFKDVPDKYFLAITSASCDHTLSKNMFCSRSPSGGSPLLGQVPHLHVCICSLLLWREHYCVYCVPSVDSYVRVRVRESSTTLIYTVTVYTKTCFVCFGFYADFNVLIGNRTFNKKFNLKYFYDILQARK